MSGNDSLIFSLLADGGGLLCSCVPVWSQPAINPHFPTNGAQIDLLASGLHSAALDTALSHYTALCCLIRCTVHCAVTALCCIIRCTGAQMRW